MGKVVPKGIKLDDKKAIPVSSALKDLQAHQAVNPKPAGFAPKTAAKVLPFTQVAAVKTPAAVTPAPAA